jgi:hypothetical protein
MNFSSLVPLKGLSFTYLSTVKNPPMVSVVGVAKSLFSNVLHSFGEYLQSS